MLDITPECKSPFGPFDQDEVQEEVTVFVSRLSVSKLVFGWVF